MCLSSIMDFCFGLVVLFLILDMTSAQSTGNGSSKKKRNSSDIQFIDITSDSLSQSFINRSSIQNNSSLQSLNNNKNRIPVLSNRFTPQVSDIIFPDEYLILVKSAANSFPNSIKTDTKVEESSSLRPVTQTPNTRKIDSESSHSLSLKDIMSLKTHRIKTISELKCEEYVGEIAGTTSIIYPGGSSSNVRKVINTCNNVNRLVIDGTDAQVGEFPHMVALGNFDKNGEFKLLCGGTLISHTWVLSAAHCTHGINDRPNVTKIGTNRLSNQEGVMIIIKRMIRNPDYKPPRMYADVALIELMNAVTFSTIIRPACLYQPYDTIPRKAWISGWGITNFADEETSDLLQKAQLDVVDNLYCSARYNISGKIPYGITPSMICAGDPRGNWSKDSCQGDSGGPLQVYPEDGCLFQVIGVVSFGEGCGVPEIPGVYSRISYYLPWIEAIVWPQGL